MVQLAQVIPRVKGLRDVRDLTPQFTVGSVLTAVGPPHMEVGALGPERLRIRPEGPRKWAEAMIGPVSGLEGRNDEIGRPLPPLSHRTEAITNRPTDRVSICPYLTKPNGAKPGANARASPETA